MASALATPHTATWPSSLSSSFGLSSSLSFMFMLFFWLFWLFWLVLLGFAFFGGRFSGFCRVFAPGDTMQASCVEVAQCFLRLLDLPATGE